eukprot:1879884-Amphidinium_carterae.1
MSMLRRRAEAHKQNAQKGKRHGKSHSCTMHNAVHNAFKGACQNNCPQYILYSSRVHPAHMATQWLQLPLAHVDKM